MSDEKQPSVLPQKQLSFIHSKLCTNTLSSENSQVTNTDNNHAIQTLIVAKLDQLKSNFVDNLINSITKTEKVELLKKFQEQTRELIKLKEELVRSRLSQRTFNQNDNEQFDLFDKNNFGSDRLMWDRKLSWKQQQGEYSIGDPFTIDFETDINFSFENLSNFEVEVEKNITSSPQQDFNTFDFKDEDALYGIANLEANAFDGEMIFMRSDSLYDFSY